MKTLPTPVTVKNGFRVGFAMAAGAYAFKLAAKEADRLAARWLKNQYAKYGIDPDDPEAASKLADAWAGKTREKLNLPETTEETV